MAEPSSDNIPPKFVVTPVCGFVMLKGGSWSSGIPDSRFPVRMNVVFVVAPFTSGSSGSHKYAINAHTTTMTAFLPIDKSHTNFSKTPRSFGISLLHIL